MTESGLEVLPASREQMPILANLIELYAHDFSEFHPLEIGDDGRFGYAPLPLYWSEAGRHPFLIRLEGKLAGFVLVYNNGAVWDVAEFFVLRGYRRRGIGAQVAHEVWSRFPKPWQVRVLEANASGVRFWSDAIASFTGGPVTPVQKDRWLTFAFNSFSC
jgi:predicted acetyltransferase